VAIQPMKAMGSTEYICQSFFIVLSSGRDFPCFLQGKIAPTALPAQKSLE
jgi:hypothetical protein